MVRDLSTFSNKLPTNQHLKKNFFFQYLVSGVCTVAAKTRQKAFRGEVSNAPRKDVHQASSVL